MDPLDLLLVGLAAGDSLGSTSEFADRRTVLSLYERHKAEGWPFRQVGGGSFGWRRGEPTDDTEMALCLYRSFRELGKFDGADVARRFVEWMKRGPRDIGNTTSRTLRAIAAGTPWHEGGRCCSDSAANGSLMRNGVVAGMADSLEQAYEISVLHGLTTHYAPLPVLCCAAQTYLLRALPLDAAWPARFVESFDGWLSRSDGFVRAWADATADRRPAAVKELLSLDWESFDPFRADFSTGMGYCLRTLQIAVWALKWSRADEPYPVPDGFPEAVFRRRGPFVLGWVAMIGYDSDTYGATAGPLIAAAHGGLPAELTDGLWIWREL